MLQFWQSQKCIIYVQWIQVAVTKNIKCMILTITEFTVIIKGWDQISLEWKEVLIMHRYHMDIPMYRYLHQIALFGCVLEFLQAQLYSITLYQWRVWNGWLVTDFIHLQHMLALFMMSLTHRLLGTKWQLSWTCFHDFKYWF